MNNFTSSVAQEKLRKKQNKDMVGYRNVCVAVHAAMFLSLVSLVVVSEAARAGRSHSEPLFDSGIPATNRYSRAELELRPCVAVRFYRKQANNLPLLLLSLFASGHPRLKTFVLDTGREPYEKLPVLLRRVNAASGRRWVHAYRKRTRDVRLAFPDLMYEDFGYVLTDMVMEEMLNKKAMKERYGFQCDTLTITNGDNVYSPKFIPALLTSIAQGNDLVASHFVTHYDQPPERSTRSYRDIMASEASCGPVRSGRDAEFVTSDRFLPWCVDLGSVMFTLKAVADTQLRFVIDKLRLDGSGNVTTQKPYTVVDYGAFKSTKKKFETPRDFFSSADGFFFNRMASHGSISSRVVRRVLLLHL